MIIHYLPYHDCPNKGLRLLFPKTHNTRSDYSRKQLSNICWSRQTTIAHSLATCRKRQLLKFCVAFLLLRHKAYLSSCHTKTLFRVKANDWPKECFFFTVNKLYFSFKANCPYGQFFSETNCSPKKQFQSNNKRPPTQNTQKHHQNLDMKQKWDESMSLPLYHNRLFPKL